MQQPTYLLYPSLPILSSLAAGQRERVQMPWGRELISGDVTRLDKNDKQWYAGATFIMTTLYAEAYAIQLVRYLERTEGVPVGTIIATRLCGVDSIGAVIKK